MEQQAAREAKRARIYDDEERVTEGERQEIMRRKAERYAKMRKGEVEEGKESTIDVGQGLLASVFTVGLIFDSGHTVPSQNGG